MLFSLLLRPPQLSLPTAGQQALSSLSSLSSSRSLPIPGPRATAYTPTVSVVQEGSSGGNRGWSSLHFPDHLRAPEG